MYFIRAKLMMLKEIYISISTSVPKSFEIPIQLVHTYTNKNQKFLNSIPFDRKRNFKQTFKMLLLQRF